MFEDIVKSCVDVALQKIGRFCVSQSLVVYLERTGSPAKDINTEAVQ